MTGVKYYRDNIMPDSPETKVTTQTSPSTLSAVMSLPRPHSTTSSLSGMNGAHSPLSGINGRTPSPHSMSSQVSAQQLPPACGARQLSKLKRFLTTLQQFGSDISPEIGERVRSLVLALVNSHCSIEEFHAKLQEATNFPLRPFVIPFLKANLPLLQRELLHCARMSKQSTQQYLAHNEHILFEAGSPPADSSPEMDLNDNGKRRSPDRPKENGHDAHMEPIHPAKRHHPLSPHSNNNHISPTQVMPPLNSGAPMRLEDISMSREIRERERVERERLERVRVERERERERFYPAYPGFSRDPYEPLDRLDDDWKHVETMLQCIIGMVDKTKRALSVLQERSVRDREELSAWMRRHAEGMDTDMKKRHTELMTHTLRQTEDRVSDVKRRAEEAVQEVKRQAVSELQKAVTAAEEKATELVSAERCRMDRTISDVRKQSHEDAFTLLNHQEESSESCWNCGRKANETCSGCNISRYCGSFCQHKDWENHHHVCGKQGAAPTGLSSKAGAVPSMSAVTPTAPDTQTSETAVTTSGGATSPVRSGSSPVNTSTHSDSGSPEGEPKRSEVAR